MSCERDSTDQSIIHSGWISRSVHVTNVHFHFDKPSIQREQVVNVADLDYMKASDYVSTANDLKPGEIALTPQAAAARMSSALPAALPSAYQTPATAGGMHTAALGGHNDFPFPACKYLSLLVRCCIGN